MYLNLDTLLLYTVKRIRITNAQITFLIRQNFNQYHKLHFILFKIIKYLIYFLNLPNKQQVTFMLNVKEHVVDCIFF